MLVVDCFFLLVYLVKKLSVTSLELLNQVLVLLVLPDHVDCFFLVVLHNLVDWFIKSIF